MKKLLALGLLLSFAAHAAPTKINAKALVQRINARLAVARASDQPLLEIAMQGTPRQGEPVVIFLRPTSTYKDQYIALEAKINNVATPLQQPSENLWIFKNAGFNRIGLYELEVSIFSQKKGETDQVRAALAALDAEIELLQDQIANETIPAEIARLEALLAEKQELRTELLEVLESLKTPLDDQSFTFTILPAAADSTTFPRILSASPNFGLVGGGTVVTLSGANFAAGFSVKIGGKNAQQEEFINSNTVRFKTPNLETEGPKDIELNLANGANAILTGGFYASTQIAVPEVKPVAKAGAAQTITLGATATLDGSGSYFPVPNTPLEYKWKLLSKPQGSQLPTNTFAEAAVATITPDRPGVYVLQLSAKAHGDTSTDLTIVTAELANAALSASAVAITVVTGQNATSQIGVSSTNAPYLNFYYSVVQNSTKGSASISNTGLIKYKSLGDESASDEVHVRVQDSMGNSFTFDVPVTIIAPPAFDKPACNTRSNGIPVVVQCLLGVALAPGAAIDHINWSWGDGTSTTIQGAAATQATHQFVAYGTYSNSVEVFDSNGLSSSQNFSYNVVNNEIPTAKFTVSSISGTAPFTVTVTSTATDALSIDTREWIWGDGTNEIGGATATHTYASNGVYPLRQIVTDNKKGQSQGTSQIWVGFSPPATGVLPSGFINVTPNREQVVGSTFHLDAAKYSFDSKPGGGIVSYTWNNPTTLPNGQPAFTCPGGCVPGPTQDRVWNSAVIGSAFPSVTIRNALNAAFTTSVEVVVVNSGHAPFVQANLNTRSGVAPLTILGDTNGSYDYDGNITGFTWNWAPGQVTTGPSSSHVYATPGVYFLLTAAADDSGNARGVVNMITVTASFAELSTAVPTSDPEQRQALTNSCGTGDGLACYELAKLYQQDGDEFVYEQLKARACELGITEACSNQSPNPGRVGGGSGDWLKWRL